MAALHVLFVFLTIPLVIYSDIQGHAWFVGKKVTLDKKLVKKLHRFVGLGLFGMVVTGAVLFSGKADELLMKPAFIGKMIFVAALVINSFFIGAIMNVATEKSYATLTTPERIKVILSAAVSIIGWVGALLCAFSLAE